MIGLVSCIFTPIVAYLFDKYGFRGIAGVIGQSVIIVCYLLLIFLPMDTTYLVLLAPQIILSYGIAIY